MVRPTKPAKKSLARARSPLNFAQEQQRAVDAAGDAREMSRSVVRTHYARAGGSGIAEVVRLDDDVLVSILNCVVPKLTRWHYDTDEAFILLRASLSTNVTFRIADRAPLVFNLPEVTMAYLPKGVELTVDILGGARQQGIVAVFRASRFAQRYGLQLEDLPPVMREALAHSTDVGRLASFPMDHRIAELVAETLDTRLRGEIRVVQYAGRLAELVAFTLDALWQTPAPPNKAVLLRRDLQLANTARERLERDYRHPPLFADLARDIGTNQNKLKAIFKDSFGLTMADYCLERRMREAQQLLLEAKLTIAQIAQQVGYEHQSSFTAAFRGHLGMAPRAYRRHRAPFHLPLELADSQTAGIG